MARCGSMTEPQLSREPWHVRTGWLPIKFRNLGNSSTRILSNPLLLNDSTELIHVVHGLLEVPVSIPGQPSGTDKDYKHRDGKQGPI